MQLSLYYMNVGGALIDDKIVDVENIVNCEMQAFNNIDFYGEKNNR